MIDPVFARDINILEYLKFRPEEGRLMFGAERLMLFNQEAFGVLRDLMFDQLGNNMARSLLAKFGFQHGKRDYRAMCKRSTVPG